MCRFLDAPAARPKWTGRGPQATLRAAVNRPYDGCWGIAWEFFFGSRRLAWRTGSGRPSVGYPLMITLHAIGMAVMVGFALVLDARLLGRFAEIPYTALHRFLGLAWIGFGINFLSGSALFTIGAKSFTGVRRGTTIFMAKMTLVVLGGITAAILQNIVAPRVGRLGATNVARATSNSSRWLSIVFWVMAIVMWPSHGLHLAHS